MTRFCHFTSRSCIKNWTENVYEADGFISFFLLLLFRFIWLPYWKFEIQTYFWQNAKPTRVSYWLLIAKEGKAEITRLPNDVLIHLVSFHRNQHHWFNVNDACTRAVAKIIIITPTPILTTYAHRLRACFNLFWSTPRINIAKYS